MPQTGTQTCTYQQNKHRSIAFSAGSKRRKPRRQPMIESTRAACGACAVDRCEISKDHGPGEASDLLRGGLGGPGLGLDVLEDCAPSAALLLLVGHDFLDSEALLATRGAHLPEAEHYMWAGGKWGCGLMGY